MRNRHEPQARVVMDPIGSINYKRYYLALLWAAQERGWTLFYIEPSGLFLDGGTPMAKGDRWPFIEIQSAGTSLKTKQKRC